MAERLKGFYAEEKRRQNEQTIKHYWLCGSLRNGSYNRALLRVAADLVPKDTKLEIFDLEGIPV